MMGIGNLDHIKEAMGEAKPDISQLIAERDELEARRKKALDTLDHDIPATIQTIRRLEEARAMFKEAEERRLEVLNTLTAATEANRVASVDRDRSVSEVERLSGAIEMLNELIRQVQRAAEEKLKGEDDGNGAAEGPGPDSPPQP